MLTKEVRKGAKAPKAPQNQFVALLTPLVIVPHQSEEKTVIADAGSIVRMADQRVMYRDRHSPITHRADEVLVYYGKADKPHLGWVTNRLDAKKIFKPVKGPTFLVQTKREEDASAWDQLRLLIGRARQRDADEWFVSWLAQHGEKHPQVVRRALRELGGKPIKNEPFDERCAKLFTIILNTEIDMKTAKASAKSAKKNKKSKKAVEVVEKKSKKTAKPAKASKSAKPSKVSGGVEVTKKHDDYIIRRLVKENPRRAGSKKAKIWDKLKKGMTVAEFVAKGGERGAVRKYIENGWAKILRPKSGGGDSE